MVSQLTVVCDLYNRLYVTLTAGLYVLCTTGYCRYICSNPIPMTYSHRVKELRLDCINQRLLSSLFQIPPGSFNHLEELDLGICVDGWVIFPNWSAQVMPVLQVLYVDSNKQYWPRPTLFLPWIHLTELEVADTLSTDNILHILRNSRRIVRCKFRVVERVVASPHLPFTLPHLAFLLLSHKYPINAAYFLGPLTLPSLEELDIMDDEMDEAVSPRVWSHQPYTALIN